MCRAPIVCRKSRKSAVIIVNLACIVMLENARKSLISLMEIGERAGIRTLDLLIKSQLLYRLSYALPCRN